MRQLYIYILLLWATTASVCEAQRTFEMAEIPSSLTKPAERAIYLVNHYWDKFDFRDTAYIHEPRITEQAFVNYLDLANHVPADTMKLSIKCLTRQAERDSLMLQYFAELMEKYLYSADSPLKNEELLIPALECLATSAILSDVDRLRPAYLLELVGKNRKGTRAANFSGKLSNGENIDLYGLKHSYTLLLFYDPDCQDCRELIRRLASSPLIDKLIKSGRLALLAVYPDKDAEAWNAYSSLIPEEWPNVYDPDLTIKNEELYDLKATPLLYLLDAEKKVLLKDATLPQVEAFLSDIPN